MNAAKHATHHRSVPVHWLLVTLYGIYGVALVVLGLAYGDNQLAGFGLTTAGCFWGGGVLLVVCALLASAATKPGPQ